MYLEAMVVSNWIRGLNSICTTPMDNPYAPAARMPAARQANKKILRHSRECRRFIPTQDRNPTAIQFSVPFGAGPIRSRLTVTTAYSARFSLIDATTAG